MAEGSIKKYKDKEFLEEQYINLKRNMKEIAKICNCCTTTVHEWLKKFNIKTRNRSECMRGSLNPNWSGGKIITKGGYIEIYKPEHPNATRNKVREHVLVMEKYLGRYITKKEKVHHINFNTSDNRIENLYLCKNHSHHSKVNHSLINIGLSLAIEEFNKGNIKFDKEKGEYYIL